MVPLLEDDDSLGGSLEVLSIKDWNENNLIVKVFSCGDLVKEGLYNLKMVEWYRIHKAKTSLIGDII